MNEEELIIKAKEKVKKKKEFYTHLSIYGAVIFFLFILNMLTSPEFWWFLIVAGGWGIGIVGHYMQVFGIPHPSGKDWEQDALKKEVAKLKEEQDILKDEERLDLEDRINLKDYRMDTMDYDDEEFVWSSHFITALWKNKVVKDEDTALIIYQK